MIRRAAVVLVLSSTALAQLASLRGRVVDPGGKQGVSARVVVAEAGRATILFPNPTEMLVITPGESGEIRRRCSREVECDRAGNYVIESLQPGRYAVVAAHPELGIAITEVELAADAARSLEIQLEPPRTLDVQVRGLPFDPTKHVLEFRPARPLGNVNVLPRLVQDGWSFHAGPLPAIDEWLVIGTEVVFEQDYRATLFQQSLSVQARPAVPTLIDVSAGKRVSGEVRGPQGEPLSGVSLVVRSATQPQAWERGAITDATGSFTLSLGAPELDRGPYRIEARRWAVREMAGCGNGPADVLVQREFELTPGETSTRIDLAVERLGAQLALGSLAPDFAAATLDGLQLELRELRGKVVLIDFWATWCAMCRAELPALEKFYAEHAKDGFEIVAVSIDDEPELVRRFLASRKLPWKQIALGPVASNPITRLYNVWGTPATIVVDRDGKIVARNLLGADLRAKLAAAIAKQ